MRERGIIVASFPLYTEALRRGGGARGGEEREGKQKGKEEEEEEVEKEEEREGEKPSLLHPQKERK